MKVTRKRTHPGEIVAEAIRKSGLTQGEFAEKLGVSRRTINELVACRRSISTEMAIRLGLLLSTTPESWLSMQMNYDIQQALIGSGKYICAQVLPLSEANN